MTKVRRWALVVVVNLGVSLALLFATEMTLRQYWRGYDFYERTEPGEFADRTVGAPAWPLQDADLGWVLSQHARDFYADAGRSAPTYTANPQGFRDPKDFAAVDTTSAKRRVMMLGDSFLFGVGLDARDAIPSILERTRPEFETYNLGIPGWGVDQMYLAYQKYAGAIRPAIVAVLYIDDDLFRSYEAFRTGEGLNKPSFDLDGQRLVPRRASRLTPLLRRLTRASIIANKLSLAYRDHRVRQLVKALFADLIAETRRRSQQILVVRIPELQDLPGDRRVESWSLKEFFADQKVPYIELVNTMPRDPALYIPGDGHLSQLGASYVAERLSRDARFRP